MKPPASSFAQLLHQMELSVQAPRNKQTSSFDAPTVSANLETVTTTWQVDRLLV